MNDRVAIIDLGTNTFHLMVAEWAGAEFKIIHRERLAVKIGLGGINRGIITEDGIKRALEAIHLFKIRINDHGVRSVFAFGTSALRSARNGMEVAGLIERESGIHVEIISGVKEAEYIYYGVRRAVKIGMTDVLIVDIGGGSVEFIIGNEKSIAWKKSFDIGAQRLLEVFHRQDPIPPASVKDLYDYFGQVLKPLSKAIQEFNPEIMIGSSGTFDTLGDIHCIRKGIPQIPDAPETPLTFESFQQTFEILLTRNRTERLQIPGMIEMRVDMIVVACCLINYLLTNHSFTSIRVSSYSLKEGVLAKLEDTSLDSAGS